MSTPQSKNGLLPKNRSRGKRWWRTSGFVFLLVSGLLLGSVTAAQALVAGLGFMWTVDPNAPVALKVCWENPGTGDAQAREWVRLALKRTWEREARIIFTGWETCQDEANAVDPPYSYGPRRPGTLDENLKIQITNTGGGQNPGHGSWGDYMSPGIILNLHHANQGWYEYLAIHEFGHALGLYHGEERSDWDIPGCAKQDWGDNIYPWWPIAVSELLWGDPDPDSVMAYCSGGPNELSPTDIAGIQSAYGRHIPGTLLSHPASLCLAAHADAANGADAFGWACDEAYDDQEWQYDAVNQALYIQWPADPTETRRCLDVDTLNYQDVQLWDCHYGANQQWHFRDVVVRGYGGLCLTRPSRSGGGALTMQTCIGASNQLWNIEQGQVTGRVRLVSTTGDLCLTKDGGSTSDAMALPCNLHFTFLPFAIGGSSAQNSAAGINTTDFTPADVSSWVRDFRLDEGGSIQYPSRDQSLCLDVQDVWNWQFIDGQGGPEPGQRVQFFDCHDAQINQKWSFSGHLQSGNKCLSLAGSATYSGAKAQVERCSSEAQQDWDYDW